MGFIKLPFWDHYLSSFILMTYIYGYPNTLSFKSNEIYIRIKLNKTKYKFSILLQISLVSEGHLWKLQSHFQIGTGTINTFSTSCKIFVFWVFGLSNSKIWEVLGMNVLNKSKAAKRQSVFLFECIF